MSRAITGVDHTLVAVRDLEAARAAFARLGFTVTPRGSHTTWDTANYCIMFGTGYIELIGPAGSGPAGYQPLDDFLARREGLMGLAVASPDADATYAALAAAGLDPSPPEDLARNLELPGGTVEPRFKLVRLPAAATPALSAFICHHLDPDMVRQPDWLDHANGARALTGITTVAADPPALADAYARLLGAGMVTLTDDILTVRTGPTTLVFATPEDAARLYPDLEDSISDDLPLTVAMTIAVEDINRVAGILDDNSVPYSREGHRAITVAPEDACGALVEFVSS